MVLCRGTIFANSSRSITIMVKFFRSGFYGLVKPIIHSVFRHGNAARCGSLSANRSSSTTGFPRLQNVVDNPLYCTGQRWLIDNAVGQWAYTGQRSYYCRLQWIQACIERETCAPQCVTLTACFVPTVCGYSFPSTSCRLQELLFNSLIVNMFLTSFPIKPLIHSVILTQKKRGGRLAIGW